MSAPERQDQSKAYACSFCGRTDDQLDYLISGPGNIYICDACVGNCNQILAERRHGVRKRRRAKRRLYLGRYSRRRPVVISGSEAAVAAVREQYEDIVHLGALRLDQLNRTRHPAEHYCSTLEHVRELWARAGAVSSFAVSLDLISPDQALDIIRDFMDAHPDAPHQGPPNNPQLGQGPRDQETRRGR